MTEPSLSLRLGRLTSASGQRSYRCRFVRAGRVRLNGNQPGNIELTENALLSAFDRSLFDGRAVFVDHAGPWDYPSLRNLAGVTSDIEYEPQGRAIHGTITLYSSMSAVASLLDEMLAQGDAAPDVGLSIVFYPLWEAAPFAAGGEGVRKILDILHVESVDLVFEPAADGRVLAALSGAALRAAASNVQTPIQSPIPLSLIPHHPEGGLPMTDKLAVKDTAPQPPANLDSAAQPNDTAHGWLQAMAAAGAGAMIAGSGLPAASWERLSARSYATPDEVAAAIEAERAYLARLAEDRVVSLAGPAPRSPHISMGLSGFEQLELALDALIAGVRPERNVRPLSGLRELYLLLSGDFEMEGMFKGERVQFANVNSSTMAGMVANALNKRVVNEFQQYPRWWEPVVIAEDFDSLQTVRWVTLGGVGELPTVAEGAAYTELTWDDLTETASFIKKGGYLGLTLEAIDKDETRRLRAAPRALAQAAWLTLSKAVSDVFTSNSGVGPTLSDSLALFHASHGNLSATALSLTQYNAIRTAMRKQTELNSGERLGALTAPKYLLVPPDLEITALQILASDKDYTYTLSNGQAAPENVQSQGDGRGERLLFARDRVIVVDLWTDTNNYAACCDPNLYPTIGVGFRYGRTPEVFSVASPTAGLMFSNDTLPVKVRYFFAVAPIDYRGLYKGNVA